MKSKSQRHQTLRTPSAREFSTLKAAVRKKKSKRSLVRDNAKQVNVSPEVDTLDMQVGSDSSDQYEDEPSDRSTQRKNRRLLNERIRRTIFVGNLPQGVSKKELHRIFTEALKSNKQTDCHVESIRFRGAVPVTGGSGKLARKRAVIQGEYSGVSQTLLAYVVLSSVKGIQAALSLNGSWVTSQSGTADTDGVPHRRCIRVDRAGGTKKSDHSRHCVFLGNLPFDVTEDELRTSLSDFGVLRNIRLIRDKSTGAVKGFGFAEFDDPSSVSLAVRSSDTISVRDRTVRIQPWEPTDPTPSKQRKPKNVYKKQSTSSANPKQTVSHEAHRKVRWRKLEQSGKAKGITLPSNLSGTQRSKFLEKRLLKKRKRYLKRQQLSESKPIPLKNKRSVKK